MKIKKIDKSLEIAAKIMNGNTLFTSKGRSKNYNSINIIRKENRLEAFVVNNMGIGFFGDTEANNGFIVRFKGYRSKLILSIAGENNYHSLRSTINKILSTRFSEKIKRKHRIIIKVPHNYGFIFSIEDEVYKASNHFIRNLLNISINKTNIDCYVFPYKDKGTYLAFDCQDKMLSNSFEEIVFSISKALGFITGLMSFDDMIVFQFSNLDDEKIIGFKYSRLRGSIRSFYTPINSNPGSLVSIPERETKAIQPYCYRLSIEDFSKLCSKVYSNKQFGDIVLLLLEGTVGSTATTPPLQSVVLEALTELICRENEDRIVPVPNSSLAKKVRKALIKQLKVFEAEIDKLNKDGFSIAVTRVNNYNSPTNRVKLMKPFELLGIRLTSEDIKVIDHRNILLRGGISISLDDSNINQDDYLRYTFLRMLQLNSMLILRLIGYKGSVTNYPRIYTPKFGNSRLENVYRLN